jgi:hypothetical protein
VWVADLTGGLAAHDPDNGACFDMMALAVTGTKGYIVTAAQAIKFLQPQWTCHSCWPADRA